MQRNAHSKHELNISPQVVDAKRVKMHLIIETKNANIIQFFVDINGSFYTFEQRAACIN